MFGKNKVSQEDIERLKRTVEIDDQFFADTGSKGEMFHATMAEIKESHRQVEAALISTVQISAISLAIFLAICSAADADVLQTTDL